MGLFFSSLASVPVGSLISVLGFFIQFHLSNMIIYKDIFTGDEMFSDSYPMKVVDEVMYEVTGKYISVKHGDIQLAGSNPSAEDAAEETDEATESGCDIVMAHRLAESFAFGDKKSYTQYLKDYVKRLQTKLVEDDPKFDLDSFKTNMNKVMKELIGRFKDLQFFTGENTDIDGMVAMMEYRMINGESKPIMMFFKHGLLAEKF